MRMKTFPPFVILIGSMGAGKTSTGKELSKALGLELLDTDNWIESKNKRTIREIFAEKGEPYFRGQEKEAVEWLSQHSRAVVSTGGGLWMDEALRSRLLDMGWCVWLKVSAEEAWKRVGHHLGQRPLLDTGDDPKTALSDLLQKREPYYGLAHYSISTDNKSAKEVAADILRTIRDKHILDLS